MVDIGMSAQRKRRAQRMASRRQRLALGPVSDHGDEIIQAIEIVKAVLVKAKQEAQVYPGGDFPEESKDQQTHSSAISTFIPKQRYSQYSLFFPLINMLIRNSICLWYINELPSSRSVVIKNNDAHNIWKPSCIILLSKKISIHFTWN